MKKALVILLYLSSLISYAQELKIKINKNPALTNEIIRIQFIVNDKASDFVPPALSNFHVLNGPSHSFQQSSSWINGEMSKEISTTISYAIQAKKAGSYIIPKASVKVKGDIIYSEPVTLIIEENKSDSKQSQNNDDVFVRQLTNKSEIYVGEQISSISKIYIKEGVNIQSSSVKPITYNGFWEDEIKVNTEKSNREIIDGTPFRVITFRHSVLTAQTSGKLSIPSSEIETLISKRGEIIGYDFFNRPQYEQIRYSKSLFTKEKIIKVKEVPYPKPKNFYGTVSRSFEIDSEIDKNILKTSEAISFKLSFRGNGNINMLDPFNMEFPESFEVFDPNIIDKTFVGNNSTGGTKTFEYILIPREVGHFIIPSIKFSYFNPKEKRYVETSTEEFSIKVEQGKEYVSTDTNNYSAKNITILTDTEFQEIKNRKKLFNQFKVIFYIIFCLIILILLVFIYLKNRKIDPIAYKKRKANKIAIKRLRNANSCLINEDFEKFFEEIEKSLWGYFADRFNVNQSKLSKDSIETYFNNNGISQENKRNFISLINDCEIARFSAYKDKNQKMEEVLERSKDIIVDVESEK